MCITACLDYRYFIMTALELSKPIDWSEITFNDGVKARIDNVMGVHCYEII